jgi:hypothetical protein
MRLMYAAEFGSTGNCDTSSFHGLSAGNTVQFPSGPFSSPVVLAGVLEVGVVVVVVVVVGVVVVEVVVAIVVVVAGEAVVVVDGEVGAGGFTWGGVVGGGSGGGGGRHALSTPTMATAVARPIFARVAGDPFRTMKASAERRRELENRRS